MRIDTRTCIAIIAGLLTVAAAAGCGPMDETETSKATLQLQSDNLPDLGGDYVWEGWLVTDDGPTSTGRFSAKESGSYSFEVAGDLADSATDGGKFVLTIEPKSGDDPGPSKTKFLGGTLSGGTTTATIDAGPALGTDFSSAEGTFFMAAPSADSSSDADYKNGIWFIDNSGGSMSAGLTLPTLPEGWAYEGWVAHPDDGPTTTGRFRMPGEEDSDGGGEAAGPNGTPPFPGQDYVKSAMRLDLTGGYKAVVSVEPKPDNSPKPFALKPLVGSISDAGKGMAQSLDNKSGSAPTMSVTLQ